MVNWRTARAILEDSCSPLVKDPPEQFSNGRDEGPLSDGKRRARWLWWTPIIGLAIAVAGGLIAFARSSRAPGADQGQTPLEVPVIEKGIGDNSTINQQPAGNPQLQTDPADSTGTAVQRYTAGSAVREAEKRFVRPSRSRRAGYRKRKPPRYKQYWRAY